MFWFRRVYYCSYNILILLAHNLNLTSCMYAFSHFLLFSFPFLDLHNKFCLFSFIFRFNLIFSLSVNIGMFPSLIYITLKYIFHYFFLENNSIIINNFFSQSLLFLHIYVIFIVFTINLFQKLISNSCFEIISANVNEKREKQRFHFLINIENRKEFKWKKFTKLKRPSLPAIAA